MGSLGSSAEAAALNEFRRWFLQEGGQINESVEFVYDAAKGVHMRVKKTATSQDAASLQGSALVSVPHRLSLSALNAQDKKPVFPQRLYKGQTQWLEHGPLTQEDLRALEPRVVDALWLMIHRRQENSWWREYIACLPGIAEGDTDWCASVPINGIGHLNAPFWWRREEQNLIDGTPAHRWLVAKLHEREKMWVEFKASNAFLYLSRFGFVLLKHEFFWALSIFQSRAFPPLLAQSALVHACAEGPGFGTSATVQPHSILYPGIDMINHDAKTQNWWNWDKETFSLVCNDRLEPGSEISNPYGPKSNDQLLVSYGFLIQNNPCNALEIKLREPFHQPDRRSHNIGQSGKESSWERLNAEESADRGAHVNRKEPVMVPKAEDYEESTFFIRPPQNAHEYPGYPEVNSRERSALEPFQGLPLSLLYMIASGGGHPRHNAALNSPTASSAARTDVVLSVINKHGVSSLLRCASQVTRWLLQQDSNLKGSEHGIAMADTKPRPSDGPGRQELFQSRMELARAYRQDVHKLISSNLSRVQGRTDAAVSGRCELAVFTQVHEAVRKCDLDPKVLAQFQSGLERCKSGLPWQSFMGRTTELAFWTLILGTVLKCGVGRQVDARLHEVLGAPQRLEGSVSLCRRLDEHVQRGSADEDQDGALDDALTEIEAMLDALHDDEDPQHVWHASFWTRPLVALVAGFVVQESQEIVLSSAKASRVTREGGLEGSPVTANAVYLVDRKSAVVHAAPPSPTSTSTLV